MHLKKPNFRMRADLFRHTLSQEMAFFDSRTVGDIQVIWNIFGFQLLHAVFLQSAMNPMVIVDIISWKIPYIIGHLFKFAVFIFYMLKINVSLTILSLVLMVIFRVAVLRPVDRKFEVPPLLKDVLEIRDCSDHIYC